MSLLPESISTYSGDIDFLIIMIAMFVSFWFVLSVGAIFYFLFRYRKSRQTKAKYIKGEGWRQTKWVEIPHILVVLCDIIIITFTIIVWNKVTEDIPEGDVQVRITGRMWNWVFTYPGPDGKFDTADDVVVDRADSTLHVPVDKTVVFELTSKDVLHSFFVRELRLKQDAVPGRTIRRWFRATKTGRYDIACAEICGYGHGDMRNFLEVQSGEKYSAFISALYNGTTANATAMTRTGSNNGPSTD